MISLIQKIKIFEKVLEKIRIEFTASHNLVRTSFGIACDVNAPSK